VDIRLRFTAEAPKVTLLREGKWLEIRHLGFAASVSSMRQESSQPRSPWMHQNHLDRVGVEPIGFHQRVSAIDGASPLFKLALARTSTVSGAIEIQKKDI